MLPMRAPYATRMNFHMRKDVLEICLARVVSIHRNCFKVVDIFQGLRLEVTEDENDECWLSERT